MQRKQRTLPPWVISAIVGFWRSGASEEIIADTIGISLVLVINQVHIFRQQNNIAPSWGSSMPYGYLFTVRQYLKNGGDPIVGSWFEEAGSVSLESFNKLSSKKIQQ